MKYQMWAIATALPCVLLAACGQRTERAANNAISATENAVSNGAEAAGNELENAARAVTPTPSGQEFTDKAAKSDAFEIAAAKLAAANASAQTVKDFAKMMVDAHTESTRAIKSAAGEAKPAIIPNADLTEDQKEDLAELGKLKGKEFDEKYLDGQVDAHQDALSLMKKYAADGTVVPLKDAAGKIAPVVEKHLARAKELKEAHEKAD